jgi:hypothetical protein
MFGPKLLSKWEAVLDWRSEELGAPPTWVGKTVSGDARKLLVQTIAPKRKKTASFTHQRKLAVFQEQPPESCYGTPTD